MKIFFSFKHRCFFYVTFTENHKCFEIYKHVFFPICRADHFYVLVFDMRKVPAFHILDNRAAGGHFNAKYKRVCNLVVSLNQFLSFFYMKVFFRFLMFFIKTIFLIAICFWQTYEELFQNC